MTYQTPFYLIGREIDIHIDRPIGFIHEKYSDLVYTINYGYLYGILGGDGEYIDAYIIDYEQPAIILHGICIAIVVRESQIDDKLIVCTQTSMSNKITPEYIYEKIKFQEKYFNIYIQTSQEKNFFKGMKK